MVCTSVFWWHRYDVSNFIAGVKSVARGKLDEKGSQSFEPTGFAAYRATVDVQRIREDPDLSWLLEKPALNIWLVWSTDCKIVINFPVRIGDQRHVMTYTIGAGKSFNMVLSHPDNSDPSTWDQVTALSDMRREFQGWDERYDPMGPLYASHPTYAFIQTRKNHQTHRQNYQMATYQWSPA